MEPKIGEKTKAKIIPPKVRGSKDTHNDDSAHYVF